MMDAVVTNAANLSCATTFSVDAGKVYPSTSNGPVALHGAVLGSYLMDSF
jgi:hypothetical protein